MRTVVDLCYGALLTGTLSGPTTGDGAIAMAMMYSVTTDTGGAVGRQTGEKMSFYDWNVFEVAQWIKHELELSEKIVAVFEKNNIRGSALKTMTHEILRNELGIDTYGDRITILEGVEELVRH